MQTGQAQQPDLVLRNGRVITEASVAPHACDIAIGKDGRIAQIAPNIGTRPGVGSVDLGGRLVVPGLVDMHQHLDKTRTRHLVPNPDGSLSGAVRAFNAYARTMDAEDVIERAQATVEACIARGTVAIRTHVNVGPDFGLRGLEAITTVRAKLADRITIQIVALLPPDVATVHTWSGEAASLGIDALGGAPANTNDPDGFLDAVFQAAGRHNLDVDLHLDEHLDASRHAFRQLAKVTVERGMQGRVVAGHCSALGALSEAEAKPIIEAFARAKIGVVALPAANLYLLGRGTDALVPRGITRIRQMCGAGVRMACASDNIQDPFVPVGTGDLLELARWTMLAAHFDASAFATAFDMISVAPAHMMNLTDYGIRIGARADLLIAPATGLADLVASGPPERAVLFGGKVVAGKLDARPA